jgi:hypothetical protein
LGISCKDNADSFPNTGGRASRRIRVFGCELAEMSGADIAASLRYGLVEMDPVQVKDAEKLTPELP